ncbi:hypothetical protein NN561_000646 [Cricetulus griseus]
MRKRKGGVNRGQAALTTGCSCAFVRARLAKLRRTTGAVRQTGAHAHSAKRREAALETGGACASATRGWRKPGRGAEAARRSGAPAQPQREAGGSGALSS